MSLVKVAGLRKAKQGKEMRDPVPALADATVKSPHEFRSCTLGGQFWKSG